MRKTMMVAGLGLMLADCSTTGGPTSMAANDGAPVANANADASLPPIYEPLVDMHRVKPEKYARDLAECRQQGAPQEAAARQAQQQVAAGTALSVAGSVASFIPGSNWRQARSIANSSGAAQDTGDAIAAGGAAKQDAATADYALVIDSCLRRKRYRLLRG